MLHRSGALGEARFAVSDRWGGVSTAPYDELNLAEHVADDPRRVAENRRRLLGVLPGADRLSFMHQVHGADVATVAAVGTPCPPSADALLCSTPGVAVVVLSADCVPVLLAGRSRPIVAVAHAGRQGVATGVVPAALDALAQQGAGPDELVALVGPAVCAGCYEVPPAMRDALVAAVPEAYAVTASGSPALDLPAAVEAQLRRAGVTDIARSPECTRESPHLYSHRREGLTGRFASVAWIPAVPSGAGAS